MRSRFYLSSIHFATLIVVPFPALSQATATREVDYQVVRECLYDTGPENAVVLRLPSSRQCPPIHLSPTEAARSQEPPANATDALENLTPPNADTQASIEDEILQKSIKRCKAIGYVEFAEDYKNCVQEQIKILSDK